MDEYGEVLCVRDRDVELVFVEEEFEFLWYVFICRACHCVDDDRCFLFLEVVHGVDADVGWYAFVNCLYGEVVWCYYEDV